jgi:hypothetical protein
MWLRIVIPEAAQRLSGIFINRIARDSAFARDARAPE